MRTDRPVPVIQQAQSRAQLSRGAVAEINLRAREDDALRLPGRPKQRGQLADAKGSLVVVDVIDPAAGAAKRSPGREIFHERHRDQHVLCRHARQLRKHRRVIRFAQVLDDVVGHGQVHRGVGKWQLRDRRRPLGPAQACKSTSRLMSTAVTSNSSGSALAMNPLPQPASRIVLASAGSRSRMSLSTFC